MSEREKKDKRIVKMELMYTSTRNANEKVTASQAILKGLAEDGGLFVPEQLPTLDKTVDELAGMTYQETAYEVMKKFLTDFTEEELKNCINNAYDSKFDTEEIAPLAEVEGTYFLELFHGKTIAFKDMALSILPHLLTTSAKKNGVKNEIVILTATSVSITVETLREMGKLNSNVGNALLGAAIIDDILGIIALSVVSSFADTSVQVSVILLKIVLYFVVMAVVSFVLYKILKNWFMDKENFKRQVIAVIGLCLLLAYISEEYFGIADITGAFVTGLIISAVGLKKEKIMFAVDDLSYAFLSPIFFASIGLKLVLPKMSMIIVAFAVVLSIVAIISKLWGCALGAKMFKFSNKESLQIGAGMVSRGEVALIVANKGVKLGIISNVIFALILIVVIITTIIAPILLKLAFKEDKAKVSENTTLAI